MIALITGTRPEIIKMAPIIKELQRRQLPFVFIHSGQHYTKEMDADIIADLQLPQPTVNLHVGSGSHAVQTGKIMEGVEKVCFDYTPSIMVVHGDTNTTLAGALVAKKLHIPVAHIEAGLRSFDYKMPEEVNRTLVDRMSDILFAPTEQARQNLLKEGIDPETIYVTGNTVVDALHQHLPLANHSSIFEKITLSPSATLADPAYILLTAHRAENVDTKPNLEKLLYLLEHIHTKLYLPIVWPMHPRTQHTLTEFELTLPPFVITTEPVGYIDMLALLSKADLVLTDSGGVQEEAYLLHKPLMTLRDSTERPETLSANFIIHMDTQKFDSAWNAYQQNQVKWDDTLGTGTAHQLIIDQLEKYL
jgi:UDP-N-acetylglucosamine 2-epimerase (non-hydrolysing)